MDSTEIKTRYNSIDKTGGSSGRNVYECVSNHCTIATHEDNGGTDKEFSEVSTAYNTGIEVINKNKNNR